jgi:predicted permease
MKELFLIFIDIIAPVFTLVIIGYFVGPKLKLQAQTLSRTSYYILVPCFVFQTLANADIQADLALRMLLLSLLICGCCALLGFLVARLMKKSINLTAAFILLAVFINVGNFGLPIITFKWGDAVQTSLAIFYMTYLIAGFLIGLPIANWVKGNGFRSILEIFKIPALLALVPVFFFQLTDIELPLFIERVIGLLNDATIPVMLLTMGVHMASMGRPKITRDVVFASAVRVIGGPIIAITLVSLFGLQGMDRNAAIMQASMPAAVLTSIVAMENDLESEFVTTSVLFSTIASLVTLTLLLYIL